MNFKTAGGVNVGELPLDPTPCPYPAGSDERIAHYARRVEQGFSLFHPDDDKEGIDTRFKGDLIELAFWSKE